MLSYAVSWKNILQEAWLCRFPKETKVLLWPTLSGWLHLPASIGSFQSDWRCRLKLSHVELKIWEKLWGSQLCWWKGKLVLRSSCQQDSPCVSSEWPDTHLELQTSPPVIGVRRQKGMGTYSPILEITLGEHLLWKAIAYKVEKN